MDAKHRHELKTNELADWLTHLPEFLKKNTSTLIGIALIIVGLVTWPMFTRMRAAADTAKAAAATEAIGELEREIFAVIGAAEEDSEARRQATSTLLTSVDMLLEQADEMDNPDQAAMAYIKAAQALRTELHVRADRVESDEIHTRIGRAQDIYNNALNKAKTPSLKAMAQFGLGLCAEELGQRDAAAQIYAEIIDTDDFAATVFPVQAQQRLDNLESNMEMFAFAPAAPEPPAGTEQPQSLFNMPAGELDAIELDVPGLPSQSAPLVDDFIEIE